MGVGLKRVAVLFVAAIILAGLPAAEVGAAGPLSGRGHGLVEGRYVVVYENAVADPRASTRALERSVGFRSRHVFEHALKGFSATLTEGQLRSLRANPKVAFVAVDREVQATEVVPLTAGDTSPTGVARIGAGTASTAREASTANVAVIDTGIDLEHPDLNAVHGVNCTGTALADDDNGHGTHVAGTIGAKNDGAGVVGVAPGTKLFAAKVLTAEGGGTTSSVLCGIDWVTSTRTDADPSNDIAVANMSLGGAGPAVKPCATTTDPEHLAICRSVAAGVTYVVAAGNQGWDFDYASVPDVPAAYPEVLTVTAMSDGDGISGGATKPACEANAVDDSYARFSNFAATSAGAAHTIAGPGSCITSTMPGGGYAAMSGTSMASPHVAGAVALCLGEDGVAGPCSGLTPAQIITKMRTDAQAQPAAYGFIGDPGHPVSGAYFGYLATAGLSRVPVDSVAPAVSSTVPASAAVAVSPGAAVSITFSEEMNARATESAFSLKRTGSSYTVPGTFSWSGTTMSFAPSAPLAQGTNYTATVTTTAADVAGNRLAASKTWSFKTLTNVSAAPASTSIMTGSLRSGTASRLSVADGLYYEVNSSSYQTAWYGRFTNVTNSLGDLSITYKGKLSRTCTQTLSLYRWHTASWVDVDSRTVGTTPVLITTAVSGTLADYVSGSSGSGDLRLRVRCQTTGSFVSSGDQMRISYSKP